MRYSELNDFIENKMRSNLKKVSWNYRIVVVILVGNILVSSCAQQRLPASIPVPLPAPAPAPSPTLPLPPPTPSPTPKPILEPGIRFEIRAAESEARFLVDETLIGKPYTVVGTTSKLSGSLLVDYHNLAQTSVGTIQIGAGSFITESDLTDVWFGERLVSDSNRDGSIQKFILRSATYPYITFTPTALEDLPEQMVVGDSIIFQIVGDLTIREITRSEVFKVTVNVLSENRLEGNAATTIDRTNYGGILPFRLPLFVDDVSEEIILEFDFVAEAQ